MSEEHQIEIIRSGRFVLKSNLPVEGWEGDEEDGYFSREVELSDTEGHPLTPEQVEFVLAAEEGFLEELDHTVDCDASIEEIQKLFDAI